MKQEIDWRKNILKVWAFRKLILKICSVGTVAGIFIALGIPKEYTASTLVAHESTRRRSSLGADGLAAMTNIDINSSTTTSNAIYPPLYPAIINSTPFLIRLFDVKVREQKDTTTMTLVQYIKGHQKVPWWSAVTSAPSKLIIWGISLFNEKPKEEKASSKTNIFRLTREEAGMASTIASRITTEIDAKKRTITLFVTMQDPLVAAIVADSVRVHLQEYVTEYRTSKARRILEYNEKLYKEAQAEYYAAQERYTRYADANQKLAVQSFRAKLEKLQNEMNLAYSVYNRMNQQLQLAKAKVEEITPVYTIIHPSSIPLKASKPRKALIIMGSILLSTAGSVGWILFAKKLNK